MCEFISWIERRGKVYFLTGDRLFNTKKGQKLLPTISPDDYCGHGTIRAYYGIDSQDGVDMECFDFSTPDYFPPTIVEAIKNGEMRGIAFTFPVGLLKMPLYDGYRAKKKSLYDDYDANLKSLYEDYWANLKPLEKDFEAKRESLDEDYRFKRKPLDEDYEAKQESLYEDYDANLKSLYEDYKAKRKPLDEDYDAKRKSLYEDYWAKRKPLYDDYLANLKSLDEDCWDLFTILENRNPAWR